MVLTFGDERAGQEDEFSDSAGEAVGFSESESEVFDGVAADVAAGGVHDQEELSALGVDEVVDDGSDGDDVVGVIFGGGAVGAGADEGEDEGWILVLGLEDADDVGEDTGTFPQSGDEDEDWFGHCG